MYSEYDVFNRDAPARYPFLEMLAPSAAEKYHTLVYAINLLN